MPFTNTAIPTIHSAREISAEGAFVIGRCRLKAMGRTEGRADGMILQEKHALSPVLFAESNRNGR